MTALLALALDYTGYLLHERKLAASTIRAYLSDLRRFNAYHLVNDVRDVTRNDLRAFVQDMSQDGYSAATIRRTMHGMATFFVWAQLEGHSDGVPTHDLPLPRKQQSAARWMQAEEVERFIRACYRTEVSLRDRVTLQLLAYTGMRPTEARLLRVADVRLADSMMIIRNTKSRRDRVMPIPPALGIAMIELCGGRVGTDYVTGSARPRDRQSLYDRFRAVLVYAGMAPDAYTPYALRHAVGTHMALANVPLHVVKDWLGHNDITTTQKYLHAAPSHLAAAAQSLPAWANKETK